MALYTPIDYNKKAKKGMKSLEKMAKGAVAGGAVAYGVAKSTQRDTVQDKRKNPNIEPSIPGCIIAILFIIGSFVLAFTVCDNFSDGLLTVMGISAVGILIFWLMSKFSEKKPSQNTEEQQIDTIASKIQYHPEQIGDDEGDITFSEEEGNE